MPSCCTSAAQIGQALAYVAASGAVSIFGLFAGLMLIRQLA